MKVYQIFMYSGVSFIILAADLSSAVDILLKSVPEDDIESINPIAGQIINMETADVICH